jgi:methylisocitrate lyase
MARTDALAVEGLELPSTAPAPAWKRGRHDLPEAMTELAMYKTFADAVKVPGIWPTSPSSADPLFTVEELRSVNVSARALPACPRSAR